MKHSKTALAAFALLVASAVPALAAPEKWDVDDSHSVAGFTIRHFFSKVTGRFGHMSGTILWDEKDLSKSSVDVTIPATSIDTQNERRDNHLRSGDFFDVEKTPNLTFKSTKVVPGKGDKFQIVGELTMRGVTKTVTLDATLLGKGAVGMGGNSMGERAGWEATTTVNRKDYGISWNKALDQGGTLLGDDVTINLGVEAVKAKPEAAPAGK